MVRTLALRSAVGALVGLMATAGLMAPAQAGPAVPIEQAGTLIGWGNEASAPAQTVPGDLQGTAFSAVAAGGGFTIALTAAGKVVVLGESTVPGLNLQEIPDSLDAATVTSVTASSNNAGAITSDGKVVVWGQEGEGDDPTNVPEDLTGVTSLALAGYSAAAVKADGTVVAWGANLYGETLVPEGLTGVKSIVGGSGQFYALKNDGTVVAWGRTSNNQLVLPAELTTPGNVKAVEARAQGGLALLTDGSLVTWGQASTTTHAIPTALAGKTVKAISTQSNINMVLDSEGTITIWGQFVPTELTVSPAELTGADIAAISVGDQHAIALVTKVLELGKPTISGTAKVGETLEGTPATFSGDPDTVTSEWLANGVVVDDATDDTLTLTDAQANKTIAFASTATKGTADPTVSTSTATAAVAPDVVASATRISSPANFYGRTGRATVTVTGAGGVAATGTIRLTGAGATQTKTLVRGRAVFNLSRSLRPRVYAIRAAYSGSAQLTASTGAVSHRVSKGKTHGTTFKVTKRPTKKKKGKATVTVRRYSGLANATGKIKVTLRKGHSKRTINATLRGGKRSITLPKLKKGTWKVKVTYRGDRNYVSAHSKTYKLKIKK